MKKITIVFSVICLLFLVACGSASPSPGIDAPAVTPEISVAESVSPTPTLVPEEPEPSIELTPQENPESGEPDEDNPVMNFVGPYYCDGCSVFIEAAGSKTCKATITWSISSSELSEWSMSGLFDEETLSFRYEDCVKTNYVYGDDGTIKSVETEYNDGSGTIAFTEEYMLSWVDETEHLADGMLFVFSGGLMDQWNLS